MINTFLIITGKLISFLSRLFNLGHGSTWPGHIALSTNKNFIKEIVENSKVKIIFVAGTNGKTTTGKLIQAILEKANYKVFHNESGANLLNGIASSLLLRSSRLGKINHDFAIFEIDENTLPLILKEINNPDFILILNLFRDQLDRYGEVNIIAKKWQNALKKLNSKTTLILNADDPQIAFLGEKVQANVSYFGIDQQKNKNEKQQHASDSTFCPNCSKKLVYNSIYFSHLGNWECKKCGYKHPEKIFTDSSFYPLVGTYNEYNTNAAVLFAKVNNINNSTIQQSLKNFSPAFGRQEEIKIGNKIVKIFLSKNPTSFNVSLRTIADLNGKNLLIVLNDRIPDGRDVSWIWDVDFENYSSRFKYITVSGDRIYDIALRLKYAEFKKFEMIENLSEAINTSIKNTPHNEILYILPTYSAMLKVRKILTGKKIL